MFRRTVIGGLLVVALVAGGVPPSEAAYVGMYTADWEGQPFLEHTDPLKRFVHYPVSDPDGDGFVDLEPIVYPTLVPVPGDLSYLTNAAIEAEMALRGITRQDVADQITLLLGDSAENAELRDAAVTNALNGDILAVNTGLTGTLLDIFYYCGEGFGIREHKWIIGVPLPADCPGGGTVDVVFYTTATRVELFNANEVNDLDLILEIKSMTATHTGKYLGLRYKTHVIGTETNPQKEIRGDVKMDNIRSSPKIVANLNTVVGSWAKDDTLTYSYATAPFSGKTVWLDFKGTTTSFSLTAEITAGSSSFSAKLTLGSVSAIDEIRANLDILSGGRKVALGAKGFPSTFKVGYQKKSVHMADEGDWYLVNADNGVNSAMANLELQGTYSDTSGAHFTFQLAGFASKNQLRISPGNGVPDCSKTLGVASIDLSKMSSSNSGRYRSIVVSGHKCDKAISVTASNVERMHLVMARKDRWENDNDALFMNGATTTTSWDSSLRISANFPWILPMFESNHWNSPACVIWQDRVALDSHSGCMPGAGGALLHDRPWTVNSYFWHISSSQLDNENVCLFRYANDNNRCA